MAFAALLFVPSGAPGAASAVPRSARPQAWRCRGGRMASDRPLRREPRAGTGRGRGAPSASRRSSSAAVVRPRARAARAARGSAWSPAWSTPAGRRRRPRTGRRSRAPAPRSAAGASAAPAAPAPSTRARGRYPQAVQYSIRSFARPATSPVFRSPAMVVPPRPCQPVRRTAPRILASGKPVRSGRAHRAALSHSARRPTAPRWAARRTAPRPEVPPPPAVHVLAARWTAPVSTSPHSHTLIATAGVNLTGGTNGGRTLCGTLRSALYTGPAAPDSMQAHEKFVRGHGCHRSRRTSQWNSHRRCTVIKRPSTSPRSCRRRSRPTCDGSTGRGH